MTDKIFSVYDAKAGAYLKPIFARNSAVALRMFEAAVNQEDHDFHRFAEDYTLFEIGEWDEVGAVFMQDGAHVRLAAAHEMKGAIAEG